MRRPRRFAVPALVAAAVLALVPPARAMEKDLQEAIFFAAIQDGSARVAAAVQTLHREGFLERLVQVVRNQDRPAPDHPERKRAEEAVRVRAVEAVADRLFTLRGFRYEVTSFRRGIPTRQRSGEYIVECEVQLRITQEGKEPWAAHRILDVGISREEARALGA